MDLYQKPLCVTCGTLFNSGDDSTDPPQRCKICDDPRQFVPATGQAWTTQAREKDKHKHTIKLVEGSETVWVIRVEPSLGIGQRAFLIQTSHGNILWDLVGYVDDEFFDKIDSMGGLKAIVISHPHFYTSHHIWSNRFGCEVYTSSEDWEWVCDPHNEKQVLLKNPRGVPQEIVPGIKAVKAGGHFPGSLVLLYEKERRLFVADTIATMPSAYNPAPNQHSYSFQWSYPNMIPLPPDEVLSIWKALEPLDFAHTHGGFHPADLHGEYLKKRIADSMKTQVKYSGWSEHEIFSI